MLARAPRFLWIILASSVCNIVAWGLLVGGVTGPAFGALGLSVALAVLAAVVAPR